MKQFISPIAHTNNNEAPSQAERGSVTLETALVMPMFLLLVFFLIFIIQTAVISMALHGALSQTVRQAASAWYPISLSLDQIRSSSPGQQVQEWDKQLVRAGEAVSRYGHLLPSPLREWAERAAAGELSLESEAAKLAFDPLLKQFTDELVLDYDRITIVAVELPDANDRSQAYLTLRAEYALPFQVPFIGRRLTIRESARERAWIGGTPSGSLLAEEDGESLNVELVSLEPDPVQPGRKATLVIRTEPGAAVDLSVIYKSGLSQAKYLGSATADASGLVSWTWHVSGRTTPGQWSLRVSSAEGRQWEHAFQVKGKDRLTGE